MLRRRTTEPTRDCLLCTARVLLFEQHPLRVLASSAPRQDSLAREGQSVLENADGFDVWVSDSG